MLNLKITKNHNNFLNSAEDFMQKQQKESDYVFSFFSFSRLI